MGRVHYTSVTRIADLPGWPLPHEALPVGEWQAGDYVVGVVLPFEPHAEKVELATGRAIEVLPGDLMVGAFGRRYATLEATGSFEAIEDDFLMHSLSGGGCFGRITSQAPFSPDLVPLEYVGHILPDGGKLNMQDVVPDPPDRSFDLPVVLIVGTSMSAGKTHAGRIALRQLGELGHAVVGAKLTGVGRWRDVLSFGDAGAEYIFDFVDAGLPATVCPPDEFRRAMRRLLPRIAATGADILVAEAGASPLEPYNGGTLVKMFRDRVSFTILCALDPYAVVGIQEAWDMPVDLVAGPAANTQAGVELVRRLAGLEALNLMDRGNHRRLRTLLEGALGGAEPRDA